MQKTEQVWKFIYVRQWSAELQEKALLKLSHLDGAKILKELSQIPGNRFWTSQFGNYARRTSGEDEELILISNEIRIPKSNNA